MEGTGFFARARGVSNAAAEQIGLEETTFFWVRSPVTAVEWATVGWATKDVESRPLGQLRDFIGGAVLLLLPPLLIVLLNNINQLKVQGKGP